MRLAATVALTMAAFAANSLLNRAAVGGGHADALAFAALRVASGAAVLAVLARGRGLWPGRRDAGAAGALALYMFGFSLAYRALDAGIGALILFGGVQVTMFAGALLAGARPPAMRWAGMALGLAGLAWLALPGASRAVDPAGAAAMLAAAVGWGVYSLIGRGGTAPLATTARAFLLVAPGGLVVWAVPGGGVDAAGVGLAVVSGGVTSGLGYALWYSVLPRIETTVAALAQLTVPVIALAGGAALLGERPGPATLLAAAVVLGGVAIGVVSGRSARAGRS